VIERLRETESHRAIREREAEGDLCRGLPDKGPSVEKEEEDLQKKKKNNMALSLFPPTCFL
jgi:hypothetical protein